MSVFGKIKETDNKIEQNKAQYDSDRQPAKTLALSSGNVGKYEFLKGKYILQKKKLLQKAVTIKRFEYSLLGKEFKAQTDIAKYQFKLLIPKNIAFDINNKYRNNREDNKSDESNITKGFDAILKDLKNNGKSTISIRVTICNVSLFSVVIKLVSTEKVVLKKDHGSNEAFNILDEIDNNPINLMSINLGLFIKFLQKMQC